MSRRESGEEPVILSAAKNRAGAPRGRVDQDGHARRAGHPVRAHDPSIAARSQDGSSSASPILDLRDVRRSFLIGAEPVEALRGVSLTVARGEWVSVVGPSGCGKSTLLNLLGAVDAPSAGRVLVDGADVGAMSDCEATAFRLRHVGFVFQRFYLLPVLTARENVELPMAEAGVRHAERAARARELLAYVGLAGRERHRPAQLSGGEQQRVAIARALANRPALLLADEPTGELDARTGRDVIGLLGRLNADGTTLVVVTHDETLAAAGRRVVHMRDGRVERDEHVRR